MDWLDLIAAAGRHALTGLGVFVLWVVAGLVVHRLVWPRKDADELAAELAEDLGADPWSPAGDTAPPRTDRAPPRRRAAR